MSGIVDVSDVVCRRGRRRRERIVILGGSDALL
jgi:hypothetical protein